ncbi:MAG: ribonuclease HII [Nitrososphaeraceae archaeon]
MQIKGSVVDGHHHHYHSGLKVDKVSKLGSFPSQAGNSTNRILGGVDEAGRGAVIGPMVIAGLCFREKDMSELERIGVKDSKELSRKERAEKYGQVVGIATSLCIYVVQTAEIDDHVSFNRLNHLEALAMAQVIDNMNAESIFVDCCDVNQEKFKANILSNLKRRIRIRKGKLHIFSFHHADSLHLAVSAASIVAKVIREEELCSIKRVHQGIGSGYPSDKKTAGFIKSWIDEAGVAPPFVRNSWLPVKKLLRERQQCRLVLNFESQKLDE